VADPARQLDHEMLDDAERKSLELFETPFTLADELAGTLGLRPGHRLLEPSAGRGALIRAALRRCKKIETVAVEISPKLCASLERQAAKHGFATPRQGDFLQIDRDALEPVDRVLMNPPFSEEIAHVRRAMLFLKPGGVLVSVMSAGVKFRKDKATKAFREYVALVGGTITDLPAGSFAAAGTMVATVVVRLVQPGLAAPEPEPEPALEPEVIVEALALADEPEPEPEVSESDAEPRSHAEANPFQTDELSIPQNVVQLVRAYEQAERDIRAGFALVTKAEADLKAAFVDERFEVASRYRSGINFGDPEDTLRELRRGVWRSLVSRLELPRFMSAKAWNALSEKIDKTEPPEVTVENVLGLAKQYRDSFEDMIRESVREVFDFLRPHHSELKTNKKVRWQVGQKVILAWIERGFGGGFRPRYWFSQHLTSLENVFSNLDGKGFANKSLNRSLLAQAIETSKDGRGETTYFKFKCFRNGNLHLEFRRMDLVNRLNMIAGGGSLKPKEDS